LKAFKKDFSKPATEATGTSIAIYLLRRASGENRYGSFKEIAMTFTMLLVGAANILLGAFIYVIVLWMWQD
jgi:hypothetical protein